MRARHGKTSICFLDDGLNNKRVNRRLIMHMSNRIKEYNYSNLDDLISVKQHSETKTKTLLQLFYHWLLLIVIIRLRILMYLKFKNVYIMCTHRRHEQCSSLVRPTDRIRISLTHLHYTVLCWIKKNLDNRTPELFITSCGRLT